MEREQRRRRWWRGHRSRGSGSRARPRAGTPPRCSRAPRSRGGRRRRGARTRAPGPIRRVPHRGTRNRSGATSREQYSRSLGRTAAFRVLSHHAGDANGAGGRSRAARGSGTFEDMETLTCPRCGTAMVSRALADGEVSQCPDGPRRLPQPGGPRRPDRVGDRLAPQRQPADRPAAADHARHDGPAHRPDQGAGLGGDALQLSAGSQVSRRAARRALLNQRHLGG